MVDPAYDVSYSVMRSDFLDVGTRPRQGVLHPVADFETALIGVFTALDLFLFYFFWESTLIPMALLIGMYGHGRKIYAAVKFFLYTMVASVFMLAAMLWLYAKTGSFDLLVIQNAIRDGKVEGFSLRRHGCSLGSLWHLR